MVISILTQNALGQEELGNSFMIHTMCHKRQGTYNSCNELPSGAQLVGLSHGRKAGLDSFAVWLLKDCSFHCLGQGFGLGLGLGLGLGASIIYTSSQSITVQGHFGWYDVTAMSSIKLMYMYAMRG